MEIIKRLPEDVAEYVMEFIPNSYSVDFSSYSSSYIHKEYPLIVNVTLNPYGFIKYSKAHIVKLIKPCDDSGALYVGMHFAINYDMIREINLLPKHKVRLICNTWYVDKKFMDLVNFIHPKASMSQKFSNAFIQMTLLCFIRHFCIVNFDIFMFCYGYIKLFFTLQVIRSTYDYLIIK